MQPNFPDAEYLLTDKVTYRFKSPQRGDVIVFEAPVANGDEYIKRIIGLPGETVSVRGGKVYVNDTLLNESYLAASVYTTGGMFLEDGASMVVPENNFFVLGDNRPYSSDSRTWGFVKKSEITGRAWLVYWPPKGVVPQVSYNF